MFSKNSMGKVRQFSNSFPGFVGRSTHRILEFQNWPQSDPMTPFQACIDWLDGVLESKCFPKGELENIKKFRSALANNTLCGHEGRYVFISKGTIHRRSYTDPDFFSTDPDCNLKHPDSLMFHIPKNEFVKSQANLISRNHDGLAPVPIPVTFSVGGSD